MKEEIEATSVDIDDVRLTGDQLIGLVGEPDKPEVQKNIDDLDSGLNKVTEEYEKRARTLEDALDKAVHFQDELMVSWQYSDIFKGGYITVPYFISEHGP